LTVHSPGSNPEAAHGELLEVMQRQHVTALLELGWSYRRIEAETGVRRRKLPPIVDIR